MSEEINKVSNIILFYESHICLWDPANRDYCNKIIKNKLLQEIALSSGCLLFLFILKYSFNKYFAIIFLLLTLLLLL